MVEIREMTTQDYQQAYALWESVPGMHLSSLDNSFAGIARVIAANPTLCLVAVAQGEVVATALGATDGRKGYLYHVAVAKKQRGQGLAKTLVHTITARLKHRKINKLVLFVVTDNQAGQEFWVHQGFKERADIKYLDLDL
ncbi:GNAT family N-acetyltransferase [Liquorilactobacillus satsumensis]|uniref:GNAT family N-acetyltransferase n=1 Tax=Liquorilactobacillus satsumensis TaxID=259059 RepID=UPI0039E9CAF6